MKKIISLLMVLVLTVSFIGCKGKNTEEKVTRTSNSVSNIESDIGKNTGLTNIVGFKINSKNQLIILGLTQSNEKKFGIYDADGKLVKDIKMDFGEKLGIFTLDAEDNIYFLNENDSKREVTVFNASGDKTRTINLEKHTNSSDEEDLQNDIAIRGNMLVDAKGNFYILVFNEKQEIEMLDKEGKYIKTLGNKGYFISDDGEDNLFIGKMDENNGGKFSIEKMNLSSGQKLWKSEVPMAKIMKAMVCKKGDKEFYTLNSSSVSKYNSVDGKFIGQVMDFKDYGLVDFNSRVKSIDINKNKDIYILNDKLCKSNELQKSELFRYNLNAKPKNNQKIITLSLMYESQYIDVAISKFQRLHPDIKIEVKNAVQDLNDPSSYEKYVKSVNTEIMSGKGSDIISMKNLPYKKYADKKALVNLNDFISKDKNFNMKDYNENIINAFKYNEGIYTLPIDYEFSSLAVNKKILNEEKINIDDKNWTWQELISVAQKVTKDKQYAFPKMRGSEIMQYLLLNNYNKFIDEDKKEAKFDSKEFIELLSLTKEFTTKKIMDVKDGMGLISAGNIQILVGDTVFMPTTIFNCVALDDKFELLNFPNQGEKGGNFKSLNTFSINKNSKYKDECWEFIKFMLSEDMQTGYGISFPVNKAALDKVEKQIIESTKDKKRGKLTQEDTNTLNKFISDLSKCNNGNLQISKVIGDETDKFIKGQQTAEQTAKIIQNKVSTMLNE